MKKSYSSPFIEIINSLNNEFCADSTTVLCGDKNAFYAENMEIVDDLD